MATSKITPDVTPEQLVAFLESLRSVRRYAPRPVPTETIRSVLEVGRWTGSAKNTQPWELLLVRDRDVLRRLAALGQFASHLEGADFAVVLVMNSAANQFDAGRLAQNLQLGAWAYGVGSCIGSLAPEENEARAKQLLGVPTDRSMRTSIAFGFPESADALRVDVTPGIKSVLPSVGRRPLDEIVHVEHYGQHEWRMT